jgi:uncharacterized protein YukE
MYRVLVAVFLLSAISIGFTQNIDLASCNDCKRTPLEKKHLLIKANCALPDGTVLAQQTFEVDATLSAAEKRAAAEKACKPILDAAAAKCDDLANRVDALKREWRRAAIHSYHEHEVQAQIKEALAAAPAYCK